MQTDPDDPLVTEDMWAAVCENSSRRAELEELAPKIVGRPMSMAAAILAGDLAEKTGMAPEDALREVDPPRRRLRVRRSPRG